MMIVKFFHVILLCGCELRVFFLYKSIHMYKIVGYWILLIDVDVIDHGLISLSH